MSFGPIDDQAIFLTLVALLLANSPFLRRGASRRIGWVLLEFCGGYGVCLLLAWVLEARHYEVFPKTPLFCAVTALLFLALAVPGITYHLMARRLGESVSGEDDSRLVEEEISSAALPVGRHFHWMQSRVRLPDGTEASREYLDHPGAVMILPIAEDGKIVFERQYRHPGRQVFIELPAGKLHRGEDKLLCAQRELLEETGYVASEWRYLGRLCPAIGYSNEVIEIYLAKSLRFEGQQLDEGEFIETIDLSTEEAVEAVLTGKIVDAKTISGVFWLTQLDRLDPSNEATGDR